jgi:hypothetical protein
VQCAALLLLLNFPCGHAAHARSCVVVPGAVMAWPGWQVDHAAHEGAFTVAL